MQRSIFLQHLSAKISEGSVKGRRNVGEVAELELFSLNMIQYYKFLNMKCFAIPFISLSTMLLKFPPFLWNPPERPLFPSACRCPCCPQAVPSAGTAPAAAQGRARQHC